MKTLTLCFIPDVTNSPGKLTRSGPTRHDRTLLTAIAAQYQAIHLLIFSTPTQNSSIVSAVIMLDHDIIPIVNNAETPPFLRLPPSVRQRIYLHVGLSGIWLIISLYTKLPSVA